MNTNNSWRRLGDYCQKIGSGSTPRGGDAVYIQEGTALIRSQNVYNGRFNIDGLAYIDEKHAEKLRGVTVMSGDVLLNITGDSVARSCRVPNDVLPARVNQHVAIIRTRPDQLLSGYLSYFLTSAYMQKVMLSLAGAGGTRKALTKEMIEGFRVPVPRFAVQERVIEALSPYDDLIENNERRIALLEQAARLLYREWFVHFRFPGHEHIKIIDGLPEGWERKRLGSVLNLKRGFDLPVSDRVAGKIPVYGSTGIVGAHDTPRVSHPTLITGRSGSLGAVCYVDEPCWPLNTSLWVTEFKGVSIYLAYFILREMNLATFGGGASVPTLDRKVVHTVPVVVPPSKLSALFDEHIQPLFAQKKVLGEMSLKLAQARELLLSRLMKGEIAV